MNRAVSLKKKKDQTKENKQGADAQGGGSRIAQAYESGPMDLDLIPDKDVGSRGPSKTSKANDRSRSKLNDSNDSSNEKPKDKTYSYVRSKRQVQTILKDKFDLGAAQLETDNMNLVKRLNGHLLELDKLNEEKRTMS
jgi:hypothetical protein